MTLSYPPPFQDLKTLAANTCLGERTIEDLVKAKRFPQPRRDKCGKRLWVWQEVYEFLAAPDNDGLKKGGPVYEAAKRYARG